MKRPSEAAFGVALRECGMASIVYKPPDDARNWKPCDYMVWTHWDEGVDAAWFEVKDVDAVNTFPLSELRPAQVVGIRDAHRIGLPYWLAVYWRRHEAWTISNAWRVLDACETEGVKSIPRSLLMSRFGIDASPSTLSSVLKDVLLGDV